MSLPNNNDSFTSLLLGGGSGSGSIQSKSGGFYGIFKDPDEIAEKEYQIEDCLRGNDGEDRIDLWELRQLALKPGGLLDPNLRKRAWPILTNCHTSILDHGHGGGGGGGQNTAAPHVVTPSQIDLVLLQRDVKRTVWNVEEVFSQKQKREEAIKRETRRVSFAPLVEVSSSPTMSSSGKGAGGGANTEEKKDDNDNNAEEEEEVPPAAMKSPSSDDDNDDDEEQSHGAASYWSFASSISCSRRVQFRKASRHEQKIVTNVVTTCLRTEAPESEAFEDDRFHYFTGLHDLAALLMVNLESPSISSLVLGKLAVYHLRDALRKDRTYIETALQMTLYPVLKQVDPDLHHHIVERAGLKCNFASSWVSNWFASDVGDIAAASRLLDAFLVSHPTLPLYSAVAVLTCNRDRLLQCPPTLQAVYTAIKTLPIMTVVEEDNNDDLSVTSIQSEHRINALAQVEDILSSAIEYMERMPPCDLVEQTKLENNEKLLARLPAVAMMHPSQAPEWCSADTAFSEFAVLQKARSMRSGKSAPDLSLSSRSIAQSEYPLAFVASGRVTKNRGIWRRLIALIVLLLLLFAWFSWDGTSTEQIAQKPKKTPPPRDFTLTPFEEAFMGAVMNPVHERAAVAQEKLEPALDVVEDRVIHPVGRGIQNAANKTAPVREAVVKELVKSAGVLRETVATAGRRLANATLESANHIRDANSVTGNHLASAAAIVRKKVSKAGARAGHKTKEAASGLHDLASKSGGEFSNFTKVTVSKVGDVASNVGERVSNITKAASSKAKNAGSKLSKEVASAAKTVRDVASKIQVKEQVEQIREHLSVVGQRTFDVVHSVSSSLTRKVDPFPDSDSTGRLLPRMM